ncbi:MAG: Wzz/FepE/Etk N-terminal domain-containing protein [Opitutales bacterium]|nr:Wzz/FepE/Etk N-terminal domain-containing protein [Opitutales bacterium]
MNTAHDKQEMTQGFGLTLGDIYYVLFRQKWWITFLSALGVLGAAGFYMISPPSYQSEAKLFILYVLDTTVPKLASPESRVKSPDERGENIINSEIEILTSMDLVQKTVEAYGAEKVLAKAGGGKDLIRAATLIKNGLVVESPKRSDVIRIVLQHRDPGVVQPILSMLIDNYIKKHLEIHRATGIIGEFLTQETDQMRSRLAQTEQELRAAKVKADVLSLDDARRTFSDQIAQIRQMIFSAEAELVERQAQLQEMRKSLIPAAKPATAAPVARAPDTRAPETRMRPDDEYMAILTRLDLLRKRREEFLTQYTSGSSLVRGINDQIAEAEKIKKKLEAANPGLIALSLPPQPTTTAPTPVPELTSAVPATSTTFDPVVESARITALQSRIKVLNSQLDRIRVEGSQFDEKGSMLNELQRKKDLQEASYKFYANSLEQARVEEALGAGKVLNINRIQQPSPPFRDWFVFFRIVITIMVAGVGAGIAMAFLVDMYLDRSVRRPVDVEKKLRLPLLLSIRDIGWFGRRHVAKAAAKLMSGVDAEAGGGTPPEGGTLVTKLLSDPLLPFYEALKDRLEQRLERRGVAGKPKLIGLTSVNDGAGVTTLTTGLAVSLSETEDRNVLLIDLDRELGLARQFYKGMITQHGLEEALDPKYKASVQNGGIAAHIFRSQCAHIMKALKSSEFDYIVFDMPPVSPTSMTVRLAGFMDEMLMVVESEKTNQDVAKEAVALLGESKVSLCAVLNKIRSYVPSSLHQEFWGAS